MDDATDRSGAAQLVETPRGVACYGLRLIGVDGIRAHVGDDSCERDAPILTVRQFVTNAPRAEQHLGATSALLHMSDGVSVAEIQRDPLRVTLRVRTRYADEQLLHPMLSGPVAIVSRWLGRDVFHAGAVVIGGRAWVLTGDKGRGKSTTLGFLAVRGVPVVTDDVLVVEAGDAIAGPAFVDLRPDAAARLGVGRDMGLLGNRERHRLDVIAAPARVPLGGWLDLAWGDRVELVPVPLEDRLRRLFANQTVQLPPTDPASFVRHAALPMYQLRRPRDWAALPDVAALLGTAL